MFRVNGLLCAVSRRSLSGTVGSQELLCTLRNSEQSVWLSLSAGLYPDKLPAGTGLYPNKQQTGTGLHTRRTALEQMLAAVGLPEPRNRGEIGHTQPDRERDGGVFMKKTPEFRAVPCSAVTETLTDGA